MNITPARLKELERAEAKLHALEAGGVDNWDYYDVSLEDYRATVQVEEDREEFLEALIEVVTESAEVSEPAGRRAGYAISIGIEDLTPILLKWGVTFATPRGESA